MPLKHEHLESKQRYEALDGWVLDLQGVYMAFARLLYVTHYPLVLLQLSWIEVNPDAPLHAHIFVAAGVAILAVLIAWGLFKAYDQPLRRYLTDRWLRR